MFQFRCSVASNSLWSHGLQHARPPCPSLTPGAYSNSCSLSWSWTGKPGVLQFRGHKGSPMTERLNNWGHDRKEHAGCHTQSHVSELKLSLMLIAHSNEQAVYHNTLWWIFTDMAITTTLTWDTSETPHKEWWMIISILFHCMAGELHFSLVSSFWHVIIKALQQVGNLEFGSESLVSLFCLLTCSFFFAQCVWLFSSFYMPSM